MSFLSPYLLWGSLAAGIPIIIHFFFRSRYRTVPWAAMEFLLQSLEETSRRIRFQELLLLIARVALLVLLALALARPTFRVGGGADGDAVDVVLLFDNSMSMDAREAGATRLERSIVAGQTILDHLPPHSTAQIIVVSDRAESLGPRQPSELDQAKSIVAGLTVSVRGSDFAPGVREAVATLRRGASPNKELFFFSDFQSAGWEASPAALQEAFSDAQKLGTVHLARCGATVPRNAVMTGIAPQTGIPHTGDRVGFAVLVKNAGLESLRDLTVSLTVDGNDRQRETQPIARLEPGETRSVSLTGRWSEPGLRNVTARVHSDDLAADDRFDQVVRVRDKVRVLVVDGSPALRDPEKSATYFLMHALLPVKDTDKPKYHVQPRLITPAQASPGQLADQDLCILANVALERDPAKPGEILPPDFAEALARFVRDGKSLLIFAGDRTSPVDYSSVFLERLNLLPVKPTAVKRLPERGEVGFDRGSANDPVFWKFRDDETYHAMSAVKTRTYLDSEELQPENGRVLFRFTDGKPAIALRSVGAGSVAFVTTSADTSWTEAPLWINAYVPLIDALVTQLLLAGDELHNASAGAGLRWYPPIAEADRPFALMRPDGRRVRLGPPEPFQGRPRVTAPDTPIAGFYRIGPADAPEVNGPPFAVVPEIHETMATDTMTDERMDERLGFKPVHLNASGDSAAFAGGERARHEWTPWLLRALLALAIGESMLALFCGRSR